MSFKHCTDIQQPTLPIKIKHLHHNMRSRSPFAACQVERCDFVNNRCTAASFYEG
jgi:hypothetical protein